MTFGSLEWIKARCREDGDCLLWRFAVQRAGSPVATKLQPDGRKPTKQVRRLMWEAMHGPIPAKRIVSVTCGNPRCLCHLELVTKAEVIRRQWAKPDIRAKLTAGSTKRGRQRSKLDMQKAQQIRQSGATLEVVAKEFGISVTLASLIRRNERWKEAASPFAGLGAR